MKNKTKMHPPGLEPGSTAWKAVIIPLDQECFQCSSFECFFIGYGINYHLEALIFLRSSIIYLMLYLSLLGLQRR